MASDAELTQPLAAEFHALPLPEARQLNRHSSGRRSVSPAAGSVWRAATTDVPKKDRVVILPEQAKAKRLPVHGRPVAFTVDAIEEGHETQSDTEETVHGHREVRMFCVAERLDLVRLEELLRARLGPKRVKRFPSEIPEVLWSPPLPSAAVPQEARHPGDVFYFAHGVVVFWCTSVAEEIEALRDVVAQVEVEPVRAKDVTWDQFVVRFSSSEPPSIQNDVITISRRASSVKAKLAISNALAQSTKLLMFERDVQVVAEKTRFIPEEIARVGRSSITHRDLNRLTGDIFMKAQGVNLVNPIMDTPEWLEEQPDDRLLVTYKRVCLYLDMHDRITIVNNRLECLKDLLALLRAQHHDADGFKLEKIVIVLLFLSALLSLVKSFEIVNPAPA